MRRIGKLCVAATLPAVFLFALTTVAPAAVETKNLLRNGDFEEPGTPPPGWKIESSAGENSELSTGSLTGNKALKISLPASGNVTATSALVPVAGGEDYLFTCWERSEGAKEGGTFSICLIWQDAQGKTLAVTPITSNSPPAPDYRTVTFTAAAPAGAANVLVQYRADRAQGYQGPPTVFYLDQVRLMKLSPMARPADAPHWEYANRILSDGAKMVDDPDAAQGKAIVGEPVTSHPNIYLAFGPYTLDQPVGEYLALFRLKVKDNTRKEPVVTLDINAFGNFNGELTEPKTVLATDFKQAGVYQEIGIRFMRPEEGALEFRVCYLGGSELAYDKVTVVKLSDFATDQEQQAVWLGTDSTMASPPVASPQPAAAPVKRDTVLVLAGLGSQIYFPAKALPPTWKVRYSYLACLQTGAMLDQPFPKKLDALDDVALVVLADIPADALDGLMGRSVLRDFVAQGGGLLVFGGPLSLGKGGYDRSVLAPVLPLTTTGPWDLVINKPPLIQIKTASPLTDGLPWNEQPVLPYLQKTIARPDAETLLESNGLPVLVTGSYGKGRVAIFTGTHFRQPVPGTVPFYEWSGYPELLTRVERWLLPR